MARTYPPVDEVETVPAAEYSYGTVKPINLVIKELTRRRVSVVSPQYPVLRHNPCTLTYVLKRHTYVREDVYDSIGRLLISKYNGAPAYNPVFLDISGLKREAIISVYDKLVANRVLLGNLYAERASTIRMVESRLWSAYHFLRDIKRGRRARALNRIKRVKDARSTAWWLEAQYGWLPLAGDIYAACKQIPPLPSFTCKSRKTRSRGWTQALSSGNVNGVLTDQVCVRADVSVTSPFVASAAQLGLINPAATGWELVPWSFVIDWFLPIGPYLESLTALSGLKLDGASVTTTQSGVLYVSGKKGGFTELSYKTVHRTVGLPDRPLPTLENPLSITRCLNALALIRELRR